MKPEQLELPFALLEFGGDRTVMTVKEAAQRLACTPRHVCELISAQELAAIDIGKGGSRMSARIPIEAFRDFVVRSMTCPFAQSPLRQLPTQALVRLHGELTAHLRKKGVHLKTVS